MVKDVEGLMNRLGIKVGGGEVEDGGLVVGVVDVSRYSRFGMINHGIGKAAEEGFMKVWSEVWERAKGNNVVVMGMPRESMVWRWKKIKKYLEEVKAKVVEVVSNGVTWRLVTNSGEWEEAFKTVRRKEKERKEVKKKVVKRLQSMPEEIYEDAMRAYVMQKKWARMKVRVMAVMEEMVELTESDRKKLEELHESATAVDDVSGVMLDPREVLKARLEELAWMRKKGVYKKITRQEAKRRGMKIVKS